MSSDVGTPAGITGRYAPFATQNSSPSFAERMAAGNSASPYAFAHPSPFLEPAPVFVTQ